MPDEGLDQMNTKLVPGAECCNFYEPGLMTMQILRVVQIPQSQTLAHTSCTSTAFLISLVGRFLYFLHELFLLCLLIFLFLFFLSLSSSLCFLCLHLLTLL